MFFIFSCSHIQISRDQEYFNKLKQTLLFIKNHFPIIFPGNKSFKKSIRFSICFEHASADFFYNVLPFLQHHSIPTVLGVSPRYIAHDSSVPLNKRLSIPNVLATQDEIFPSFSPFCSWYELKQICNSPFIKIASHSLSLKRLSKKTYYLKEEISKPKNIIHKHLNISPELFIFPTSSYCFSSLQLSLSMYKHVIIKKNTFNFSSSNNILYSLKNDSLLDLEEFFVPRFFFKNIANYVRTQGRRSIVSLKMKLFPAKLTQKY